MLNIENFSFRYASSGAEENGYALKNINLHVSAGELVLLKGKSGSGKSTLLKMLKKEIAPNGESAGAVIIPDGLVVSLLFQDIDSQCVSDSVLGEIAFSLENLGVTTEKMRKIISETVSFFGIESLLSKNPANISGGEKQLVCLCAAVVSRPDLLLLDEPLSQLDSIARANFVNILRKLCGEFGITIIISEHKTDDIIEIVDRVVFLENGQINFDGTKEDFCAYAKTSENASFLPETVKIQNRLGLSDLPPVFTTKELRSYIMSSTVRLPDAHTGTADDGDLDDIILKAENIKFSYGKQDILYHLDLEVQRGEFLSILGGNGSGKSTLLKVLCKILKPELGRVVFNGKDIKKREVFNSVTYIPQNPKMYFTFDTVLAELQYKNPDITAENSQELTHGLVPYSILNKHPFDLSGGQTSKLLLALALITNCDILMLDEITKGVDPKARENIGEILKKFKAMGKTIILVSHDSEFCAKYSDRAAFMFDKTLTLPEDAMAFFKGNFYYTTVAARVFRGIDEDRVIL